MLLHRHPASASGVHPRRDATAPALWSSPEEKKLRYICFKITSVEKQRKLTLSGLKWQTFLSQCRIFLLTLLFSVVVQTVFAQHHAGKKTRKLFEQAKEAYRTGRFSQADVILRKVLKHDSLFVEAYLLQGDVFASGKEPGKAIMSYRKALAIDSVSYPAAYYVLARLEMKTGKYASALRHVRHYLKQAGGAAGAEKLLQNAAFAVKAVQHPEKTHLMRLNNGINTPQNEYINFVNEDRTGLIFTRMEATEAGRSGFRESFYRSQRRENRWQRPQKMHFPWDSLRNMGAMSLSVDGRTMYFTGCSWPEGYGRCDIFVSRKRGYRWLYPQHPGPHVNTAAWDAQAVVSADGNRLFFASNRPGGKGGSDIWMCRRQPDGRWGKAINLGDSINTPGNEMAPFLHADGQTLYFSSNGRTGLGGYDLYLSRLNSAGQWTRAVNLGYPVNTRANEKNIFVSLDGRYAWLSSDRDTLSTGYDIYSFPVYRKIRPQKVLFVKGTVQDALTGKKLAGRVVLTDLTSGKTADSLVSDAVTGRFLLVLHTGRNYALDIVKEGYLIFSQNIDLKQFPHTVSIHKVFQLVPVQKGAVMRLQNVHFAFDSALLRPSALPELMQLVRFLKSHPRLQVLIAGYTDNRGRPAYNLTLSQQRAKAVFDFLVSKGIDPQRLQYKGYGDQNPVAANDTPEGRAANRRTEIVIR